MTFNIDLAVSLLPDLAVGALVTGLLLLPTLVLGMAVALPIALARLSGHRRWRWPGDAFASVFRGCPLLILLYIVYYGLPQIALVRETALWTVFREPFNCAIFAFSLNHAAFLSEIWRGGLLAVPKELREAAAALALSKPVIYARVLLPLAFRYGLSAYRNEVILYVKATAVVGAITVTDLLDVANTAVSQTYDPLTPLLMAAALYWVIVQVLQTAFDALERDLAVGLPTAAAPVRPRNSILKWRTP